MSGLYVPIFPSLARKIAGGEHITVKKAEELRQLFVGFSTQRETMNKNLQVQLLLLAAIFYKKFLIHLNMTSGEKGGKGRNVYHSICSNYSSYVELLLEAEMKRWK